MWYDEIQSIKDEMLDATGYHILKDMSTYQCFMELAHKDGDSSAHPFIGLSPETNQEGHISYSFGYFLTNGTNEKFSLMYMNPQTRQRAANIAQMIDAAIRVFNNIISNASPISKFILLCANHNLLAYDTMKNLSYLTFQCFDMESSSRLNRKGFTVVDNKIRINGFGLSKSIQNYIKILMESFDVEYYYQHTPLDWTTAVEDAFPARK